MPPCSPTYTTTVLPHDPILCGPDCDGVVFQVSSVASSIDAKGDCRFEWSVLRDRDGVVTEFAGVDTVECPGVKKHTFHCASGTTCAKFVLTLRCGEGMEEPPDTP